jgi:DNA-binding Xre family transcriptional regulator
MDEIVLKELNLNIDQKIDNIIKKTIYDLYEDFDWEKYKELNPFLYIIGLRAKKEYEYNYLLEGRYIGRVYNENQKKKHSFHILLATIGNKSIFNIIAMLQQQLNKIDYLTVVYDAKDKNNTFDKVQKICENFECKVNIIMEEENLGFWGHGIRNKYNDLEGDYIYHIDDDDILYEDSMEIIRKQCNHKNTIYIFKIRLKNNNIIWVNKRVEYSKISTQSGVIPMHLNKEATWTLKYGGDYDFYKELHAKYNFVFVNKIIYHKN